ncbi:MAG TPA: L,D-transpeptidase family protein [Flavisolibacter sp.]|jgi:murein L,D-transpeptidase YcbB/YkuD
MAFLSGCNSNEGVQQKEIVETPQEINAKAEDLIENTLQNLLKNPAKLPDSIKLKNATLLQEMYGKNSFGLLWSSEGAFNAEADSLFMLVDSARLYGLFPSDYYAAQLKRLRTELQKNTSKEVKLDAAKWAYTDMLSTSAFIQLVKDLKFGRLLADSVLVKDTSLQAGYFSKQKQLFSDRSVSEFALALEPVNKDYHALKAALRQFLPKASMRSYTWVKTKDSLLLKKLIYQRISEEDSLKIQPNKKPDSLAVANAIKKFQKRKKLREDGKISTQLVNLLNSTDKEKFIRIAITLDKYKMLPTLPEEYIWVNLPSYVMEVRKGDSVTLTSKVICGKPITKTPQLTSAVSDMITYPKWTIPESIIKKEILPGLKRNAGYALKRGYSIVDLKGNEISPYGVTWAKYKNSIPYKVVQGSGDANALGVIKFNFANPYAVYLHDTNQRYLFDKKGRALSHGCVRVHKWRELAYYLLRRDSLADSTKYTPVDSLDSWLAQKIKKTIRVRQQLPLFIRYFSAEGRDGKLLLHEDIYEEDKRIREKLFASR